MIKALITVIITREIEYDPDFYETDLTDEEFLQEEIKYAEDLFHEWIEADGVKFHTQGKIVRDFDANPKSGQIIVITGNTNDHLYDIGQEVIITNWKEFDSEDSDRGVETEAFEGSERWFVRHTDYQIK